MVIGFLKEGKINSSLIQGIVDFGTSHPVREGEWGRIPVPQYLYYGREVWEQAVTVLLCGQNLLPAGSKATGKNILVQNPAVAFGRSIWDISLHANMDVSGPIGTDTFQDRAIVFRPGSVYRCGISGDSGVLDEISMARNKVLAVLHGTLDFGWTIDVPNYNVVRTNGGTRSITTMNYGYADTRRLNEAPTSRFACLQMPVISGENLEKLVSREYPSLERAYARQFVQLSLNIDRKCQGTQFSTHPLGLRGLLDAIRLMEKGLDAGAALDMGFTNKSFDSYGQNLARGLVRARTPKELERGELFADRYGNAGI